jgi:hypothetical protein
MFFVYPPTGSFAPLNGKALLDAAVAKPIRTRAEALNFAKMLESHRKSGRLREMAVAGWRRFDICGFANIAAMLESEY